MLITANIQSFYTLNEHTKTIDRAIILYGGTFYAITSFLPLPLILIGLIIPRRTRIEKFGTGRYSSKIAILLTAAFLLCLGASFRVGTNYKTPRPRSDPPGYFNKACFYIFNFTVEFLVIVLYVVVRVDRRFHVPNGSKRPGDYMGSTALGDKERGSVGSEGGGAPAGNTAMRVKSEEDVFDDAPETQEEEKGGTSAGPDRV
ncbi:MAG: hypothetical protein Q9183_006844 [Haloplaca sp. 2 TL-2023]